MQKTNFNLRRNERSLPPKDPGLTPVRYSLLPINNMFTGELMYLRNIRRL